MYSMGYITSNLVSEAECDTKTFKEKQKRYMYGMLQQIRSIF